MSIDAWGEENFVHAWTYERPCDGMPPGKVLRIRRNEAALVRWNTEVNEALGRKNVLTVGRGRGVHAVDLPPSNLVKGACARFTYCWQGGGTTRREHRPGNSDERYYTVRLRRVGDVREMNPRRQPRVGRGSAGRLNVAGRLPALASRTSETHGGLGPLH